MLKITKQTYLFSYEIPRSIGNPSPHQKKTKEISLKDLCQVLQLFQLQFSTKTESQKKKKKKKLH